jgi:hypothetical protein
LIASERVTWVSEGLSLPASAAVSDSARQCGEERSEQERPTRRANLVPCKEHVRRKFTVQEITMIHLCLVFSAQLARLKFADPGLSHRFDITRSTDRPVSLG